MKQPRAWSWPELGISSGSFSQNSSTNAEDGFRKIIAPPQRKTIFILSPHVYLVFFCIIWFWWSYFDRMENNSLWRWFLKISCAPKKKSNFFYNAPPPFVFFFSIVEIHLTSSLMYVRPYYDTTWRTRGNHWINFGGKTCSAYLAWR